MKKTIILCVLALFLLIGLVPQQAYALTYEQTTASQPKAIWDYLYARLGNAYGVAGIMGNMYMESGLRPNNLDNTANSVFGMSDEEYTNAVDSGTYTDFATDRSYYGLNQWGGSRKQKLLNYAKSIDASVGSLTAQLGFVMQELNTGYFSGLKNEIMNATSIRQASDRWLAVYGGVPNKDESSKAARASRGQVYFDAYAPEEVKNPQPQIPAVPGDDPAPQTQPDPDPDPGNTQPDPGNTQTPPSSGSTDTQPPAQTSSDTQPPAKTNADTASSEPVVYRSNDSTLKSLSVSGCTISPRFRASVTSYSAEVNYGVTSVSVNAQKNHSKASVSISGGGDLQVGSNSIRIVVTAEDGSRRTYTVNVVRREKGIVFDADEEFTGTQELEEQQPPDAPGSDQPAVPDENNTSSEPAQNDAAKKGSKEWYKQKASLTWESIVSHPVPYYIFGAGALILVLLILLLAL